MNNQRDAVFWVGTFIAVLAGAWTVIHLIWNFAGLTGDDYWGTGLLILFALALILSFFEYARERPTLKAAGANERFPEPAISRFFLASTGSSPLWFVVRMNVGAQWLLAGFEKVGSPAVWGTSGKAISGFVAGALTHTSGAHASVQGWYAWFLQNVVLPNAGLWSFLITWGEVAVGVGLLLGILTGIAAGFGVLMNLNYLLAGTVSINPVLGMLGLFLVISWRVCGYIGFDRWLLPALGMPWKPGPAFHARGMPASGQ